MALGSTQPLTEMSTRNTSWGVKGGRCVGLITLPPSCADCLEIWEAQPPGTLGACPGLHRDCFTFTFTFTLLFSKCLDSSFFILSHVLLSPWFLLTNSTPSLSFRLIFLAL